ncbi:MAG: LysE family transporter [Paracoccaceae bacterium]|nr:LysE family transporter [Paracoccaceae bacterium]
MTLAAFLTIAVLHLLAAISPGPSFVVSIRTAAAEGFRPALGLAIGFGAGAVIWATAALAGLALLFQILPALFTALKVAGGLFLLWIAWQTWRHARAPLPEIEPGALPTSLGAAVLKGLAVQLANPKPAVFFGAVFVGLVPPETPLPMLALVMGVIFIDETLWYILVARLFSLPRPRALYARMKAGVDRTFGVLLAGLGLHIALP